MVHDPGEQNDLFELSTLGVEVSEDSCPCQVQDIYEAGSHWKTKMTQ